MVASTNDHVDTINRAVQNARLTVGHLDPDVATRLAAGEHAYVGDVVATRRNDRRLTTSGGEPVRNRDTWTVTAINDDGSITVSHRGGHGDVTLPADYVHEHVRLGYAATEHGWQSDTVDTAIALTSPVTTRRGLYVAATRGRDDNILCVVTDSDDIAEARDVLDAILAVDRADIPATTQRRALAQSTPRQATADAPTLTPRCEIPDWFPAVLAEAQAPCATPKPARRNSQRGELRQPLQQRARTPFLPKWPPQPPPIETPYTTPRPERSKHAGVIAPRNIDSTPPLAGNAATCATRSTPPSSSSNAPRTTSSAPVDEPAPPSNATPEQSPTSATRTTSSAAATPSTSSTRWLPSVGEHRLHVQALTTWQRWAQGHDLPNGTLHTTFAVLAHQPGVEQQLATALRNDLPGTPIDRGSRVAAHVDLPGVHVAQHDFGIEL